MTKISEKFTTAPEQYHNETEQKAFALLDELGIAYERVDNEVVETMEECKELDETLGAEIRKTILLNDKKKSVFVLAILPAAKRMNSSLIEGRLGCTRLSFSSAERMEEHLKQLPGAASVMGLLNDPDGKVKLVIDREVAEEEWFGCNSGSNEEHLKFRTQDLLEKLLPAMKHTPIIMKL